MKHFLPGFSLRIAIFSRCFPERLKESTSIKDISTESVHEN